MIVSGPTVQTTKNQTSRGPILGALKSNNERFGNTSYKKVQMPKL